MCATCGLAVMLCTAWLWSDMQTVGNQSSCVHKHVVPVHAMYALLAQKGLQKITQGNPSYVHAQDLRGQLSD